MKDWRLANRGAAQQQELKDAYELLTVTAKVQSYSKLVCKHNSELLFRKRSVRHGRDSGIKVKYNHNAGFNAADNEEKTAYGRIVNIYKHTLHEGKEAPSRTVLDVEWFGEHKVMGTTLRMVEEDPGSAFNTNWRLTFMDGVEPVNVGFVPDPPNQANPTTFAVIERHELSDIVGDFTSFN
jgi:hypothetical protein